MMLINLQTVVAEYTVTVKAKVVPTITVRAGHLPPDKVENTVKYVAFTPFVGVNESGDVKDVLASSDPELSIEDAIQSLVDRLTKLEDDFPQKPKPAWEITD